MDGLRVICTEFFVPVYRRCEWKAARKLMTIARDGISEPNVVSMHPTLGCALDTLSATKVYRPECRRRKTAFIRLRDPLSLHGLHSLIR